MTTRRLGGTAGLVLEGSARPGSDKSLSADLGQTLRYYARARL